VTSPYILKKGNLTSKTVDGFNGSQHEFISPSENQWQRGEMDLYLVWLQEVAVLESSLATGTDCRA
jgi:hypothetical protein